MRTGQYRQFGYIAQMLRGPLSDPNTATRFAGHETFPLRRLWLRKAYNAVVEDQSNENQNTFDKDQGLIRFGVGKNMVSAIRYWAITCRIIEEAHNGSAGTYATTDIGDFLFGAEDGVDPYLESIATVWLIHWLIASDHERATTWFYAFNHLNASTFDREGLAAPLRDLCKFLKRTRSSDSTIKRDVECFVRSYVAKAGQGETDDQLETILTELGLIVETTSRAFEFRRGPKSSLPDGVFLFALAEFWQKRAPGQSTLAVEAVIYEPGSPGRIFKMDEHSVVDRLVPIGEASNGVFNWSDTAGVRNISRISDDFSPLSFLPLAYASNRNRFAA